MWTGIRVKRALVALGLSLAVHGPVSAQSGRPVMLVVPFAAGGGLDILARSFNNELGAALGQPVIVEYRPGPGVGASFVAKSAPDSQVLLVAASSHSITALLQSKPSYHPIRDFAAVAHVGTGPQVLLVNAQQPARTLSEFIAQAKAEPGRFDYGSAGNGSSTHLAMAYLASVAGLDMVHIPYKSNAAPITELIAGRLHAIVLPTIAAMPYAGDKRVRMLAVTSSGRSQFLPSLPTVAESGYPGFTYESWFGLLGPASLSPAFVQRIDAEIGRLLQGAGLRERLMKAGIEPLALTAQEFGQLLRADYERMAKIVKLAGAVIN